MRIAIAFALIGILLGYVLGIRLSIKATTNYFISLGYKPRESLDIATKIIKENGEIE